MGAENDGPWVIRQAAVFRTMSVVVSLGRSAERLPTAESKVLGRLSILSKNRPDSLIA